MARLILLSVKDNEAADAIVKLILKSDNVHKEGWGDHVQELGAPISAYSVIEWVMARPLAWWVCASKAKDNKGWGKTKRFGWWVHAGCNRCSRMVVVKFVSNLLNGHYDLLTVAEYKLPEEPLPVAER
jgi:hypothetical protein